jgi:hypothetical protein
MCKRDPEQEVYSRREREKGKKKSSLGRVCKPGDPPQLLTKAPALKREENLLKVPLFKGDLGGSESDRVVCRHALTFPLKNAVKSHLYRFPKHLQQI